jgi:hypothetical protein
MRNYNERPNIPLILDLFFLLWNHGAESLLLSGGPLFCSWTGAARTRRRGAARWPRRWVLSCGFCRRHVRNSLEGLWRDIKGGILANEPTPDLSELLKWACEEILGMGPTERLQVAGRVSGNFWLPT